MHKANNFNSFSEGIQSFPGVSTPEASNIKDLHARVQCDWALCQFARVQEASQCWSVYLNILEARANSGFYKGLLKLQGTYLATAS